MSSARTCSYTREIRRSPTGKIPESLSRLIGDRYMVLHELGKGGMSAVYRATDLEKGRDVALKFPLEEYYGSLEARESFCNEITALSKIKSDRIVHLLDYAVHEGEPFMAMELMEAPVLHLYSARLLGSLREILEKFSCVCDAVQDVHDSGFVHRDLKEGNVFVLLDGSLRLFDFGFARYIGDRSPIFMKEGGTYQFIAPERRDADALPHPAEDIYSLGAMLYHMLSLDYPVDRAGRSIHLLKRHIRADIMTEKTLNVTMRALNEKPEKRFPTAAAMKYAVLDCIESLESAA